MDDKLPLVPESSDPSIRNEFDRNGKLIRIDFYPNADQLRFAASRASFKNDSKTNEELLKELRISKNAYTRWVKEYGDSFHKWLEWFMDNMRYPVKEALFLKGYDMAMRGEYNYWKDVSRTVGAISSEKVEITANIINKGVEELADLSDTELIALERQLLKTLRGAEGEDSLPSAPGEEEPGCSEDRDGTVPEESLVLPVNMDSDGRLPG